MGARLFFATPRQRALLCLGLAVAAGGAMVTVNTGVLVRDSLHRSAGDVSWALDAFGGGSMAAAAGAGLSTAAGAPAGVAPAATVAAVALWPRRDPGHLGHVHSALPAGHPHVRDAVATRAGWWHGHDYRIGTLHTRWPTSARSSA
ncbi:hypothetical protein [Streptomyces sp. NPDC051662]|uniref:hypothetical protein n=1 Tax=Streptomyces sp. NPDC051662 TaxID=3154750 RepID=UPI00344437D8